jgi:hypothetical protein
MNKKFFVVLVCLLVFSSFIFAKGIGTTMFQILQMPTNAYDAALANTASAGEMSAIQNPALIPFLTRTIILTHAMYIQDTGYSVADVNLPITENSGINFSFCYFDMGSMTKTTKDSGGYRELGKFNANDKLCTLSYGTKISYCFYAGLSLKYIKQTIDDVSYCGFATSLSGLYFISDNVCFSLNIKDIGPQVKGYSLPSNVNLGVSSTLTKTFSTIVQADNYYNDDFIEFKFGMEKHFIDIFSLRAGYVFPTKQYGGTNNSFITNLTLGTGLRFKGFFVDYAWLPKKDLGNVHMFTIRVNF